VLAVLALVPVLIWRSRPAPVRPGEHGPSNIMVGATVVADPDVQIKER